MVSAAHFSFMGICRNTTFEVLYCNLFSGISRWYHYHKSEVNSMKAEKKEINIQIGKRLQTARENSGYTQEVFAETLDVGVEHYRKIESGVYGLQPEKMLIFMRSTGLSRLIWLRGIQIIRLILNCSLQTVAGRNGMHL